MLPATIIPGIFILVFSCLNIYICIRISSISKSLHSKKRCSGGKKIENCQKQTLDISEIYHLDYTPDVSFLFKFKYVYEKESWRAYILNNVDYGGRSTGLNVTHKHFDSRNNEYYVCWNTPVKLLDDMVLISKRWAEATVRYIRTGERF